MWVCHSERGYVALQRDWWIALKSVPESLKEVTALSAGAIAKPAKSPAGWHVIKVTEIKPKRQMTADESLASARTKAGEAKRHATQKFWLGKLRAAAKIEIDDAALRAFVAEYEFKGDAPPQHGAR
jgi:peptidylprolyl isomerase